MSRMTAPTTNHHAPNRVRGAALQGAGMSWKIPTFRQFDQAKRHQLTEKYSVTLTELSAIYGPGHYRKEWEDAVVELFEAGASFPTKQWNSLPQYLQRRVLRSPRALKMPGNVEPWKVQG